MTDFYQFFVDAVAAGETERTISERPGISGTAKSPTARRVCGTMRAQGRPRASLSWPGDIFVEDTNAETNIDLIEVVLAGTK